VRSGVPEPSTVQQLDKPFLTTPAAATLIDHVTNPAVTTDHGIDMGRVSDRVKGDCGKYALSH
jgi:hypothetical protein